MKGSSLTFFPESYSDVWIYIIRKIMISNIYDVYFAYYYPPNNSLCKDRKDQHFVQKWRKPRNLNQDFTIFHYYDFTSLET